VHRGPTCRLHPASHAPLASFQMLRFRRGLPAAQNVRRGLPAAQNVRPARMLYRAPFLAPRALQGNFPQRTEASVETAMRVSTAKTILSVHFARAAATPLRLRLGAASIALGGSAPISRLQPQRALHVMVEVSHRVVQRSAHCVPSEVFLPPARRPARAVKRADTQTRKARRAAPGAPQALRPRKRARRSATRAPAAASKVGRGSPCATRVQAGASRALQAPWRAQTARSSTRRCLQPARAPWRRRETTCARG